jgi:catechol 2,3-dioxygenase-like lactoylglutathione lyase family enzyme
MDRLSRRRVLKTSILGSSAALLDAAFHRPSFAEPVLPGHRPAAAPNNPLAARAYVLTIVTPDMGRSLDYYRDLLGFEVIRQSKLPSRAAAFAGAGDRQYALLRAPEEAPIERGVVRLLQAPPGGRPNRPPFGLRTMNPGLGSFGAATRDVDAAYAAITGAGFKTFSPPTTYRHEAPVPAPGSPGKIEKRQFEITVFSVSGPAGEQMMISGGLKFDGEPPPVWKEKGAFGPIGRYVVWSFDRRPLLDFYEKAFGLETTPESLSNDVPGNETKLPPMIGAPPGTHYIFGNAGDAVSIEWHEYPQFDPAKFPRRPTALDRTGFAMVTLLVDDLTRARARASGAGLKILGQGALPTPGAEAQEGFYLRGGVGELVEVIGRRT